jgi:hypothetical protein
MFLYLAMILCLCQIGTRLSVPWYYWALIGIILVEAVEKECIKK